MARKASTVQASRSAPTRTAKSQSAKNENPKPSSKKAKRQRRSTPLEDIEDEEEESINVENGDAYQEDDEADNALSDDERSIHSDALDDDSDGFETRKKSNKGKFNAPRAKNINSKNGKHTSAQKSASKVGNKRKRAKDEEDDAYSDVSLEDGQQVVGRIVQAPTTGRVPSGRISQNTFNFLRQLMNPECNDREWFKLHDPVWRQAEKEWVDFVDALIPKVIEMDDQIPPMPSKDLIHRIYRDVRFSNDKTPYKTNLSMSVSRSGRKGIFAAYHVSISPGRSIIAAGVWCPGRNEQATIRSHILRNPSRLREVISSKEFVQIFGPPKPHPVKGERQNIFGHEDMLKVAPKGVAKDHKDIDLLKLRSIAVIHRFLDSEVVDPHFADNICRMMNVMKPLVHCLNDMMTIPPDDVDEEDSGEVSGSDA